MKRTRFKIKKINGYYVCSAPPNKDGKSHMVRVPIAACKGMKRREVDEMLITEMTERIAEIAPRLARRPL